MQLKFLFQSKELLIHSLMLIPLESFNITFQFNGTFDIQGICWYLY